MIVLPVVVRVKPDVELISSCPACPEEGPTTIEALVKLTDLAPVPEIWNLLKPTAALSTFIVLLDKSTLHVPEMLNWSKFDKLVVTV